MNRDLPAVTTRSPPAAVFNEFLYAQVQDEDQNGMALTVLSALARQNVDPWEQAADLCQLPDDMARQKLASMLEATPGYASPAERMAVAARLIPLLPNPASDKRPAANILRRLLPVKRQAKAADLSVVLIYLALMIVGEWLFSTFAMTTPAQTEAVSQPASVTAPAAVGATSAGD
jgi:hypothetical protein